MLIALRYKKGVVFKDLRRIVGSAPWEVYIPKDAEYLGHVCTGFPEDCKGCQCDCFDITSVKNETRRCFYIDEI